MRISTTKYAIWNLSGLLVSLFGLCSITQRPLPPQLRDAGHYQFLTNLSLILTIFAILSNLISLVGYSWLKTARRYLNASATVAETIVAMIYWSLKIFLIHLIVPASIPKDRYIPLWLDLIIHLFPITFLSLDYFFIQEESFKIPFIQLVTILSFLTAVYWNILETLVKPPNSYPYPFLNVPEGQRMVIFIAVGVLGIINYHIYELFHSLIGSKLTGFIKMKKN